MKLDIGPERSEVLNTIARMLADRDHETSFDRYNMPVVDGVVCHISISQRSRFDPVIVQLLDTRPTRTFRRRKDGTYNYDGIVESIELCVKVRRAKEAQRKQRLANRESVWVAEEKKSLP